MPSTSLTLAGAKQYMTNNFVSHTFKKTTFFYFELLVYDVQAIEEMPNLNSIRKRQFRLYAESDEDTAKAWWEATQGPMPAPIVTPEITFSNDANNFLISEVAANKIKVGKLIYTDDNMERATAMVVATDGIEKFVIIKKTDGIYSMEDYTPILSVST